MTFGMSIWGGLVFIFTSCNKEFQPYLHINLAFSILHYYWDLENLTSDWVEIWNELLEWVGVILP